MVICNAVDFFEVRALRRSKNETQAMFERATDQVLVQNQRIEELEAQVLRAWWNGMEDAAEISSRYSRDAAGVIRKRIQERAAS